MCSILGILDAGGDAEEMRRRAVEMSRVQRHRGPDWSGVWADADVVLAHERLAIVGVESGAQPIVSDDGELVLAVNGEIYNHRELAASFGGGWASRTGSDCEVILELYRRRGTGFLGELDGIFAFVLYDRRRRRAVVARDAIGVVPLYLGRDALGRRHVASEMKALVPVCATIEDFPPGHLLDTSVDAADGDAAPRPWFTPRWRDYDAVGAPADPAAIRRALEEAVARQLMSEVPYAALLSGGLDSSLVAAIAARHAPAGAPLQTWSVGLVGSPDLAAARVAARAIGTEHRELVYTLEEGLDALADVVYHLETYDVTTIRAATPMFLLARRIKSTGVKMVLSGEGADEVFGGYLYFHRAPDARAFHEETVRKLDRLHKFDCLRANKATAAWGVEARVPFLATPFLDVAMAVDPAAKMVTPGCVEKRLLRTAFAGVLPDEILWRQKEQFSDGVGYAWIDTLKAVADKAVTAADLAGAAERFPVNPPATREAYLYRTLFAARFPDDLCAGLVDGGPSIACSSPTAIAWDAAFAAAADPSGRAVAVHRASRVAAGV